MKHSEEEENSSPAILSEFPSAVLVEFVFVSLFALSDSIKYKQGRNLHTCTEKPLFLLIIGRCSPAKGSEKSVYNGVLVEHYRRLALPYHAMGGKLGSR